MTTTVAKDQRREIKKNHPAQRDKSSHDRRHEKEPQKPDRQEAHVQQTLQWSFAT